MTEVLDKHRLDELYDEEDITPKKHRLFWIMMAGFMFLIFVRNIYKIEYPIAILLGYACFMAMLADHDETMALAVSFIPFSAAFQYRYALLAIIVIYAIKHWEEMKNINLYAYIPLVLMMCWEASHALLGEFSLVLYLQGFSELMFCSFVISLPNKKFDYSLISRVLAITIVFCCSVSLWKLLETVDFDFEALFLDGNYRFGIVEEDASSYVLNYNANALGFMCNMGMLSILLRMAKHKANIFDIVLIVAQIVLGFLTVSRSFTICLLLSVLLYVFAVSKNVGSFLKYFIAIGAVVAIALLVINFTAPYIIENLFDRFGEDDVTGGRTGLLEWYNEYLFDSPGHFLFGTGLQNILDKVNMSAESVVNNVPHNGLQELLVVWGVLGILLLGYMIVLMLKLHENKSLRFANIIPAIVMFVMIQSGQLITSGKNILALFFIYVILCTNLIGQKENDLRR